MSKTSSILITKPCPDYELIDSGDGEKLERFGSVLLSRPDPQALWAKRLPAPEWKKAGGVFTREEKGGGWSMKEGIPSKWNISFGGLTLTIKPTAFKHTGLFPEQEPNWTWMREKIQKALVVIPAKAGIQGQTSDSNAGGKILDTGMRRYDKNGGNDSAQDIEVLNLFGYTGGASLACAQAGAKVVHIDSSKAAVAWARENAELSRLKDAPIRWIIEDARVFVEREIKRGRKYDGIMMDPPSFGHGPTSELWKIEEHFLALVEDCKKLLKDAPLFFLINGYSAGYSAVAYENNLLELKEKFGGNIETGELTIEEGVGSKKNGERRLLPSGIFARWSSV